MKMPLIIEGFWNVGKTSMARHLEATAHYRLIAEPNHEHHAIEQAAAGRWYIGAHQQRQADFMAAARAGRPVILERSILSTAAYIYAARQTDGLIEEALQSFVGSWQGQPPVVVFLYQDQAYILNRHYSLQNQNILHQLRQPEFVSRYEDFYRHILPTHYNLCPLFIKQEQGYHEDNNRRAAHLVALATGHQRLAQINVVVFKRNPDLQFLLLKRSPRKGGFWQSVTGGVKPGHGTRQTVERELAEELGVTVDSARIVPTDYTFHFTGSEGYELNEYVYGYELAAGDAIRLSPEHTDYAFAPLAAAQERLKFDTNKTAFEIVAARAEPLMAERG